MNQDNISGKLDQVTGKIKQGLGEAVGNDRLANEGAAQQVKGHAKEAWGNIKDTAAEVGSDSTNEAKLREERSSTNARDSITSAAEHAKESINRGLDHLKSNDRA